MKEICDYFHVGILEDGDNAVGLAFGGVLPGRDLAPISEIGNSPARLEERTSEENGAGGIVREKVHFSLARRRGCAISGAATDLP